ncbi:MAG: hypothetical protein NZO16_00050 [Deltaproteobacteria bacterium]|nr:hypothetical protein [Deltaproteobacteria bacterium]
MIIADFHTHFYRIFFSHDIRHVLAQFLSRFSGLRIERIFVLLAEYERTCSFQDFCQNYGLREFKHDDITCAILQIKNVEVLFIQAFQIHDVFGNEFTRVGKHFFLNYAPFKYLFNPRRKIFMQWLQQGHVIGNPFNTSLSLFAGSDCLPYKFDLVNFLKAGSILSDNFDLNDLKELKKTKIVGTYNLTKFKLVRFFASQRLFSRIFFKLP